MLCVVCGNKSHKKIYKQVEILEKDQAQTIADLGKFS